MKVSELIERLKKFNPDFEVRLDDCSRDFYLISDVVSESIETNSILDSRIEFVGLTLDDNFLREDVESLRLEVRL